MSDSSRLKRIFSSLVQALRREAAAPLLPVFLSWRLLLCSDAMAVHRAAWAGLLQWDRQLPQRFFALLAALLIWPLKTLPAIYRCSKAFSEDCRQRLGRSRSAQILDQLRLALFHSVAPVEYYTYDLADRQRRAELERHIFDGEAKYLARTFNADPRAHLLVDKRLFAETLVNAGMPAVETLAWTVGGRLLTAQGRLESLPDQDLFIKPVAGQGGLGTLAARFIGNGEYLLEFGPGMGLSASPTRVLRDGMPLLTTTQLLSLLRKYASYQALLVQPRLCNHPAMADLSTGSLLTVRALTGMVDGKAELVRAVLRIGLDKSIVVQSGLAAPIDELSGVLGQAVHVGPKPQRYAFHPELQTRIADRLLPDWQSLVHSAIKAHELLEGYSFIAWDIALTPQGPRLLEGNVGFGTETLQKPHGQPLMTTRFAAICLAHIAKRRRG